MGTRGISGSGSVVERKLKSGKVVYDVYVSYVDPATGARRRHKESGFPTKTAANARLRKLTSEVDEGKFVRPAQTPFGAYVTWWVETARLSAQTRNGYVTKTRLHIVPHIGHIELGKLQASHLNELYARLESQGSPGGKGPLSPASVLQIHNIISGALTHAMKSDRVIASNPAALAVPPRKKDTRSAGHFAVWNEDEVRTFLDAEVGSKWLALWCFLVSTGCRRGEALGLTWRRVDLKRRTAYLQPTVGVIRGQIVRQPHAKAHQDRPIDLDTRTVAALAEHKERQRQIRAEAGDRWVDEDLVWAREPKGLWRSKTAGGPVNGDAVAKQFDIVVTRHGLPDIRVHDLRHTWATLALASGVHVKIVQERLGHATPQITLSTYSHVLKGMQAEAAQKVADLFAPRTAPRGAGESTSE